MEANQLRIGNWVELKTIKKYTQMLDFEMLDNWYSYMLPIPLTPEILEKAGFELSNHVYKHKKAEHNILLHNDNKAKPDQYMFIYARNENNTQWAVEVQYVHQLQNLYFVLTGEELNIDL